MATFLGTNGADVANAITGQLTGFTGGTLAELQDAIGDVFYPFTGQDTIFAGSGSDLFHFPILSSGVDIGTPNSLHGGGGNDTFRYEESAWSDSSATVVAAGEIIDGGTGLNTLEAFGLVDFRQAQILSIGVVRFHVPSVAFGGIPPPCSMNFLASQVSSTGLASALSVIGNPGTDTYEELQFTMGSVTYFDISQFTFSTWGSENFIGITGDESSETIIGSSARDSINGGSGYDNLYGGAGDDIVDGAGNEDIVAGDAGNDTLYGGSGNDILSELAAGAQSGNDTLYGGLGIDIMYAGDGNDTVYGDYSNFAINNDITNNYGNLGLGNDSYIGANAVDVVVGGDGLDLLVGAWGDDSLYGENGNDDIYGDNYDLGSNAFDISGAGIDLLSGGVGDDKLYAGGGNDLLVGDEGNDILFGQQGIDVLYGGADEDILNGGGGTDGLYGGAGNDQFWVGGTDFGYDYIWDFQVVSVPAVSDRLVFQQGHFANAAAVRAASVFASGNTTITVPGSNGAVVVLVGVNIANILDEDLIVNGVF